MSETSPTALRCAIHVHTQLDDGSEPMEEVIRIAREKQVDVLMTTGHNHLQSPLASRWQGFHDGLLVIVGTELETRDRDHLLSFGLHDRIATRLLHSDAALELLQKLGTHVLVAHPQGRPRHYMFGLKNAWKYWSHPGYFGVEIWSYMHDWIEQLSPMRLKAMCAEPERFISGPHAGALHAWDEVARSRRVCGVGALDTHGKKLPFHLGKAFPWAKEGILPYAQNFSAFSTYLQTDRLASDAREATDQVLRALRNAACWACHDAAGMGRGFLYSAKTPAGAHPVGTEMPFAGGVQLQVHSPLAGHLRILNRGEVVAETEGTQLQHTPTEPGEYRATVDLDGRPWILSNHIYLRQ